MTSRAIAAYYMAELQNGVNWLAVWQTDPMKHYNAELFFSVVPNGSGYTVTDPVERERMLEIMKIDMQAAIINGYEANFPERMTISKCAGFIQKAYDTGLYSMDIFLAEEIHERHLTYAEWKAANRKCHDGTHNCAGCPNAKPGTLRVSGIADCITDMDAECVRILEILNSKSEFFQKAAIRKLRGER